MAREFEWDPRKAELNLKEHRVSFDEATTVFRDTLSITIADLGTRRRLRVSNYRTGERNAASRFQNASAAPKTDWQQDGITLSRWADVTKPSTSLHPT